MTESPRALEGIRVLDCTQILSGPYCAALLGDLGADVIKVERPDGGDDVRSVGTVSVGGSSPQYHAVNRNKRSLALDIRVGAGRDAFLDLVCSADVLVENFRPGVLDRLGLGYDVLHELNPRLIMCSISGFGQSGPYRNRPGFDLIAQGASGLLSMTGSEDGELAKIGVPITDIGSAMNACIAVLAAIIARDHTGEGQRVETSLMQTGIAYTVTESSYLWATGQVAKPNGTAHRVLAPYQAVRTRNGHILIGCGNDRAYQRLCEAVERPELATDPRFVDNRGRVTNRQQLLRILEDVLATRDSADWIEFLNAAGCASGPVNDIAEVFEDPQAVYAGFVVELDHPTAGTMKHLAPPFSLSQTPALVRTHAPLLGEHTRDVLAETGRTPEQIDALIEAGAVHVYEPVAATP